MTIRTIRDLLSANVLAGEDLLDLEIRSACGSDLMSDVLAFVKDHTVLITGLVNPQVVRTAEMLDVSCIVFARGKHPQPDLIEMAHDRGIALLATDETMYVTCGILYKGGLPGSPKRGAE
jgi:serine kinase of HPr protein (carbohydrate metabolism regulator)